MRNNKGFVNIILIIIIIALLGGSVYLVLNKNTEVSEEKDPEEVTTEAESEIVVKDETSDWKTYQNIAGFSFKYPPFLIQKSYTSAGIDFDSLHYCEQSNSYRCIKNGWNIRILVINEVFNPKDVTKFFDIKPSKIDKLMIKDKDYYIASNTAFALEEWLVHTQLGDKVLQISFSGNAFIEGLNAEVNQTGLQRINQILSTIQFLL